jgi:hypothetical protein
MSGDGTSNSGRVSRRQAAALLGVSVATVRRLEGRELHPQAAADGTYWFDEAEVRNLCAFRGTAPKAPADPLHELAPATPARTAPPLAEDRLAQLEARVQQLGQGLRQLAEAVQEHEQTPHGVVCERCGTRVGVICVICESMCGGNEPEVVR